MNLNVYRKGMFCTLPIIDFRDEGDNTFFVVSTNNKEYAIRMYDFQKSDPSIFEMKELPCMVKEVHGDNIVLVQNSAQMFREKYISGQTYPFVVDKEISSIQTDFRYYDIRDENGMVFRLKCKADKRLTHNQKIRCNVSRPNINKMILTLENTKTNKTRNCISPETLLDNSGINEIEKRFILRNFTSNAIFSESRQCYRNGDTEWVIKAIMAVENLERWTTLTNKSKCRLLECYHRICLYLIEDSDYLHQFSDSEISNYQMWIGEKVAITETYQECMLLVSQNKCDDEVDAILGKIRKSGYIYRPHKRMSLLIAMFTMQPNLLDKKIDVILDLLGECGNDWKVESFKDAFAGFLQFYVTSNWERANSEAAVANEQSKLLLNRMVRSVCYLLLITKDKNINISLYRSMLYYYLSFVRNHGVPGNITKQNDELAELLLDHAFTTLVTSSSIERKLTWSKDFSNTELFAYKMSRSKPADTTFSSHSFEAYNVRFTISSDGITLSRTSSAAKDKNVLPEGVGNWHNLQIYLNYSSKYYISSKAKLKEWRQYWSFVEQGLFEKKKLRAAPQRHFMEPEVGTETYVRVMWKDDNSTNRYYCKIEDSFYKGEGWLDTYQKGGALGLFHYDPELDINSFYIDGKPMLIKVRVNSVGSSKDEKRTYVFDAISYIDDFIQSQIEYGEESNCKLFFKDSKKNVFCGVTEWGYGIFMPGTEEMANVKIGDTVKVRVTDSSKANAIQGEMTGFAEEEVDVKTAAEEVLRLYVDERVYEETDEDLEEEDMSVSEDTFDIDSIKQLINIFDRKAVLETDNVNAYAFLAVAHILARMIANDTLLMYIEKRQYSLCLLEDFGTNGKVNDDELAALSSDNADMVEKFPLLKQGICEMRIINSLGQHEKNPYLWSMVNNYGPEHVIGKLSRLILSYNMADGFGLHEQQKMIVAKIKKIQNVNVELPKIYSFGEEDQLTEFKSSIVFPPDNNMREDMLQQTFNIMKVICGMTNAYGGNLYLGVYDTGTAKGLEDDLKFFDDSKDKFDLYVRNQIRTSLGDSVNAKISIAHPEAGKHWIYVIKIAASKTPVMLRTDKKYYLREGTSTYEIDRVQLTEIMNERDFAQYNTPIYEPEPEPLPENSAATSKKENTVKLNPVTPTDDKIATSSIRSNITESWHENYGLETYCYLRIFTDCNWCMLDDVEWDDGIITLAIHDDELDGFLIVAYGNGNVNKVPMAQLTDKERGSYYKMYSREKPIFMCPVRKDDALLTVYVDYKGRQFIRLDDVSEIEEGKMLSAGNTLTDVDFESVTYCEIVARQYHDDLKRMHNLKRNSLGLPIQTLAGYKANELEVMQDIGIKLQ